MKKLPDIFGALLALSLMAKGAPGLIYNEIWVSPKHSPAYLVTGPAAQGLGAGWMLLGFALVLAFSSRWGVSKKVAFTAAGLAGALAVAAFVWSIRQ